MRTRMQVGLVVGLSALALLQAAPAGDPITVGSVRQLFIDNYLVDRMDGAALKLHPPVSTETVLEPESPWEGQTLAYPSVLKDGDRYRLDTLVGKRLKTDHGTEILKATAFESDKKSLLELITPRPRS